MLEYFKEHIANPTQKLEFAMALPARESIQFLEGTKYITGSDYSTKELNMTYEYNEEGEEPTDHYEETIREIEDANQSLTE